MSSAQDLIGQIETLPSLSAIYFRVKLLIEDPNSSMNDIAREISCDPAVTSRLLRLVNSPFYGMSGKIETVSEGLTLLGTAQIHDLVLATSVATAFEGVSPLLMDMQKFWRLSLYRALVAHRLAVMSSGLDSDRAFVEGLLADLGHLIMYLRKPHEAQRVLEASIHSGQPLYRVERELLGFDYADVGAELLAMWNLSPNIISSVRCHPDPLAAREPGTHPCILHVATMFADATFKLEPIERWSGRIDPLVWRVVNVGIEDLAKIKKLADEEFETVIYAIFPDFRAWRTGKAAPAKTQAATSRA